MERWYLSYDGRCMTCRRLAALVRDVAADRIMLLDLHDDHTAHLLRRAFPAGWRRAPYVIVVRPSSVAAWTGMVGLLRLVYRLGPRRSWALARAAHHAQIRLVPPIVRARRH